MIKDNFKKLQISVILILLAGLMAAGCAKKAEFDVEMNEYYNTFESVTHFAAKSRVGYRYLDSMPAPRVAACAQMAGIIYISLEYWNKTSKSMHEQIVLHELGHCVLYLNHDDTRGSDGYTISIMSTYLVSDSVYKAKREMYLQSLNKR
jgi:hypothetical protein